MRFSRRAAEARRLAALRKDSSAAEETMICKVPGQQMEYAHPPLASVKLATRSWPSPGEEDLYLKGRLLRSVCGKACTQ
mgnify:CR=1 FL=1